MVLPMTAGVEDNFTELCLVTHVGAFWYGCFIATAGELRARITDDDVTQAE